MERSADLTAFLAASAKALRAATSGAAARAAETVISRWELAIGAGPGPVPARLPVCDWLPLALAGADSNRATLAQGLAGISDRLRWTRRLTADPADTAFWNGHANAMILGPGGLEDRGDIWIGVTLMAPGVRYADHDHPPEEVYLSLGPGEWWNAAMDWNDPGPTGCIYNPPGIAHAMRSGDAPFLALWYLPA